MDSLSRHTESWRWLHLSESVVEIIEEGYTPRKTNFTLGYVLNGVANLAMGRVDEAEERFEEALAINPGLGPVIETIKDILGGIRSACTYVGASALKELTKRTTFIRVQEQENQTYS